MNVPKGAMTTEEIEFHQSYWASCPNCGVNVFVQPVYLEDWSFQHDFDAGEVPSKYTSDHGDALGFIDRWCRERNPDAWQDVYDERDNQDSKWGEQNHAPLYWLGIIAEELGELAKELIENQPNYKLARGEAVQVAACAIAMIQSMDRNELKR